MTTIRDKNYIAVAEKVAAIRAGITEDALDATEIVYFACSHHKDQKKLNPLAMTRLSVLSPSGREGYLGEVINDIRRGKSRRFPPACAEFLANLTGKEPEFWRRESYTLAEAESIQFNIPGVIKPEPTIATPVVYEKGVKSPELAARDLAKLVLFPPDLNSSNIARVMKERLGPKGEPHR